MGWTEAARSWAGSIWTCIRAQGKNKWFNAGTMVTGVADRQLPEARLNGNFAGGSDASDPGLMQYSDVVTFFHEFGHMMHAVLGSHQE